MEGGGGVSHPEMVSTAATLEDWEKESIGDSVSKRDRGEETGAISLPSTKLFLLCGRSGVDVTPEPALVLYLGTGLDVTPEPMLLLVKGTGTNVAPEPQELLLLNALETEVAVTPVSEPNVGEETGGISLPSVGALAWQTGSEINMASGSELG